MTASGCRSCGGDVDGRRLAVLRHQGVEGTLVLQVAESSLQIAQHKLDGSISRNAAFCFGNFGVEFGLAGAFSAATKLLAKELTSTPEPEPSELIRLAAADLAAALPVGVPLFVAVVVVEVLEVVAVTMVYTATFT